MHWPTLHCMVPNKHFVYQGAGDGQSSWNSFYTKVLVAILDSSALKGKQQTSPLIAKFHCRGYQWVTRSPITSSASSTMMEESVDFEPTPSQDLARNVQIREVGAQRRLQLSAGDTQLLDGWQSWRAGRL